MRSECPGCEAELVGHGRILSKCVKVSSAPPPQQPLGQVDVVRHRLCQHGLLRPMGHSLQRHSLSEGIARSRLESNGPRSSRLATGCPSRAFSQPLCRPWISWRQILLTCLRLCVLAKAPALPACMLCSCQLSFDVLCIVFDF